SPHVGCPPKSSTASPSSTSTSRTWKRSPTASLSRDSEHLPIHCPTQDAAPWSPSMHFDELRTRTSTLPSRIRRFMTQCSPAPPPRTLPPPTRGPHYRPAS